MTDILHRTTIAFELDARAADSDVIPAVLSTDSPVAREGYREILRHTPEAIDLARFPLPVIEAHDQARIPIGVAEHPRLDGGKLRADIRFGASLRGREVCADVLNGIIRSLSVGYRINQADEAGDTLTALRWTPFETSLVACPADPSAGFFRSAENALEPSPTLTHQRPQRMSEQHTDVPAVPAPIPETPDPHPVTDDRPGPIEGTTASDEPEIPPAAAAAPDAIARAVAAERTRAHIIRLAARTARVDDATADALIGSGASADAARAAIIEAWSTRMNQIPETGHVSLIRDEGEVLRGGIENFLGYRMGTGTLDDNGQRFASDTFYDLCKRIMPGLQVSKSELIARVMSTSDFPLILANVANKTLRQAYQDAPRTFEPIVRRVDVPDFKAIYRDQISNYPALSEVPEGADITESSLSEAQETYAVKTYAKGLSFTRQAQINDDLNAFTRALRTSGYAVAALEADLVWAQLTGNPNMGDSIALFYSTHHNLATGAAIDVAGLAAAKTLLRLQTSLEGRVLNLLPRYLAVPAALENLALQYTASIAAVVSSAVNPFAGALQLIVEPRLDVADANAFYMIADPNQIDTIELAKLSGVQDIISETEYDFDSMAFKMHIVADRGAKVIDFRGFVKNPGVN